MSWLGVMSDGCPVTDVGVGVIWPACQFAQLCAWTLPQRSATVVPVALTSCLLPLLEMLIPPAVTPALGTLSRSSSSFMRATMLRGLPRTTARDWTHSWLSSFQSTRHGVTGHAPFTGSTSVWLASAGSYALASTPLLSRTEVDHVAFALKSVTLNWATAGLDELAAASVSRSGQYGTVAADEAQSLSSGLSGFGQK